MKKVVIFGIFILLSVNSYGLFIYQIKYSTIRLVISNKFPKDGNLVCSANFTKNFNISLPLEDRLVYSCVSDGVYYNRKNPKNIGVFTYYNNKYYFSRNKNDLRLAELYNGMGFLQWMVIDNYLPKRIKTYSKPHHFRVLAEKNGKLYFIEADFPLTIDNFIKELLKLKVKNAIYLDTGEGWETFYYKENNKIIYKHIPFYKIFPFRTNFLVFK